jgi:two-component system LytT family response regulator
VKLSCLIADDEPLARRKLRDLVAQVPWATQVGEVADGRSVLGAVMELGPDVVFLDIEMPEMSGIQVVEQLADLPSPPAVIFTTAFDEFAVAAFELEALDYLLKPFGMHRLLKALERARSASGQRNPPTLPDRVRHALDRGETLVSDRVFVRHGGNIIPLPLASIERIQADDDYSLLHAAGRRYMISLRIGALEAWLPNPPFLRVHRSHIVNLDHVERLSGLDDARFDVHMRSGAVIRASRARSQEIRRLSR